MAASTRKSASLFSPSTAEDGDKADARNEASTSGAVPTIAGSAAVPVGMSRIGKAALAVRQTSTKLIELGQVVCADYPAEALRAMRGGQMAERAGTQRDNSSRHSAGHAPSTALLRWQKAVALLTEANAMNRDLDILRNNMSTPADRFAAAVRLKMQESTWSSLLASNPQQRLLQQYRLRKLNNKFTGFAERVETELYLTGLTMFEWCTPAKLDEHYPIFTAALFLTMWVVFWFMAAQYPYFTAYTQAHTCLADQKAANVPANLNQCGNLWMTNLTDWRYMTAWTTASSSAYGFSFDFMRAWGGRYAPDIAAGDSYRWFTGEFVHTDFQHVLSNMLLFAVVSLMMETKYGTCRTLLLWFISMLAGNFLSCALENPCIQVVGASGGIFGLFGLFIADLLLNFQSVKAPLVRTLTTFAVLGYFLYASQTELYISHISHIGGLTAGLFCGFLFLPRLGPETWEAWLPLVGVLLVLGVFVALPVWIYQVQLPSLRTICPQV